MLGGYRELKFEVTTRISKSCLRKWCQMQIMFDSYNNAIHLLVPIFFTQLWENSNLGWPFRVTLMWFHVCTGCSNSTKSDVSLFFGKWSVGGVCGVHSYLDGKFSFESVQFPWGQYYQFMCTFLFLNFTPTTRSSSYL